MKENGRREEEREVEKERRREEIVSTLCSTLLLLIPPPPPTPGAGQGLWPGSLAIVGQSLPEVTLFSCAFSSHAGGPFHAGCTGSNAPNAT